MLRYCVLLLIALLCCSIPATAAQPTPTQQVFLPTVRDPGGLVVYSTIALVPEGVPHLFIQRAGGGPAIEFRPLVAAANLSHPSWSPDGSRIAFVAFAQGMYHLYTAAPDGSQVRLLTVMPGILRGPVWSPDSQRIAFAQSVNGHSALYSIDVASTALTLLTSDLADPDGSASWSPDGQQIVFSRTVGQVKRLIVRNVQSAAEHELDTGAGGATAPAWSPDGSLIAFATGTSTIAAVAPDGSGRRVLFEADPIEQLLGISVSAWSPDGRHVAAHLLAYKRAWFELIAADGSGSRWLETSYLLPQPSIVGSMSWGPQQMP